MAPGDLGPPIKDSYVARTPGRSPFSSTLSVSLRRSRTGGGLDPQGGKEEGGRGEIHKKDGEETLGGG